MIEVRRKERIVKCEQCGKNFKLLRIIYDANIEESGEETIKCPFCNQDFYVNGEKNETILAYKI